MGNQAGAEVMTDRSPSYDLLLARESEARERIARARHTIQLQLGDGTWNLHQIDHILNDKAGE